MREQCVFHKVRFLKDRVALPQTREPSVFLDIAKGVPKQNMQFMWRGTARDISVLDKETVETKDVATDHHELWCEMPCRKCWHSCQVRIGWNRFCRRRTKRVFAIVCSRDAGLLRVCDLTVSVCDGSYCFSEASFALGTLRVARWTAWPQMWSGVVELLMLLVSRAVARLEVLCPGGATASESLSSQTPLMSFVTA